MEKILQIADYRINVKEEGCGDPVMLLHSYWGSSELFDRLSNVLSVSRRVIRIDLPGHGKSEVPPEGFTFEKFAPVLDELFSRLGVTGKVSIVGHSMGGYVAMAYASRFPDKLKSLVLMHSPVTSADDNSIRLREREGNLIRRGKKDLLLQVSVPSNFSPYHVVLMADQVSMVRRASELVPVEGALRSIYAINHRANSLPVLQKMKFPILIIVGKSDMVYDPTEQIETMATIPSAELCVLENSGHMGFMEEERVVIERLESFLSYFDRFR